MLSKFLLHISNFIFFCFSLCSFFFFPFFVSWVAFICCMFLLFYLLLPLYLVMRVVDWLAFMTFHWLVGINLWSWWSCLFCFVGLGWSGVWRGWLRLKLDGSSKGNLELGVVVIVETEWWCRPCSRNDLFAPWYLLKHIQTAVCPWGLGRMCTQMHLIEITY